MERKVARNKEDKSKAEKSILKYRYLTRKILYYNHCKTWVILVVIKNRYFTRKIIYDNHCKTWVILVASCKAINDLTDEIMTTNWC